MPQSTDSAGVVDLPSDSGSTRSNRIWIFIAAVTVIFIAAVEGTIMSTAMPAIVGTLGGFKFFTWTFAAYFLAQAATIPLYGGLADIYGRKPIVLAGIGIFLVGSALCGVSWNMPSLIAFRALQGLGAGALVTLAQTIIGDIYRPIERARLQGYIAGTWAAGAVFGPIVGGLVVTHVSWPWVFWINIPIGLLAATMIILALHESRESRARRIDFVGSILIAVATTFLMLGLVQASTFDAITILALLATSAVILVAFTIHEGRTQEPMLPLPLLRNRIVTGGSFVGLTSGAVLIGSTAFLALYLQGVMGLSVILSGLTVGAPFLTWPFGSFIGGRRIAHSSYRSTAFVGLLPLIVGVAILVALKPQTSPLIAALGPSMIGFGFGFIIPTFLVAIQSNVSWQQRGIATSMTVFTRIVGQAIGTAVFGGILNSTMSGRSPDSGASIDSIMNPVLRQSLSPFDLAALTQAIADGLHYVFLTLGVLVLMTGCALLFLPRGLRAMHQRKIEGP